MSKLTHSKFARIAEEFPKTWMRSDLEGLKKHVEEAFAEYESQYVFHNCFFHDDEVHIMLFSEGNAFVLTVSLEEKKVEEKPAKMAIPTPKPWYVRFWS